MDRLWLLAAALLFSTGGAAVKGNGLTSWQVASFRSLLAAAVIAALIPSARRNWRFRHFAVAVAYAANLISFVTATKLTTAANAIFLQSTAPAYLTVLSPLLLRERLSRSDLWLLGGVSFGMVLFFLSAEPARTTAPDPVAGNLIALFCGIAWAFVVVGFRWLGRQGDDEDSNAKTLVIGNLLAFALALPMAFPVRTFTTFDAGILLYMAVFQLGLAYYCMTRAIRTVPAFEAATLMLVEPALNPVWTWLILGERPSSLSIGGGVVILASTLLNTWWRSRPLTRAHPYGAA